MSKIIKAVFGGSAYTRTEKVFRFDTDDYLQFFGVNLPDTYQVHFSNSVSGESKTVLGNADGVPIPWEYFSPGSDIFAWVWVSTSSGGFTKYQVVIPVSQRAHPTEITPTPSQQDALDQAIYALNNAVTDAETYAGNAQSAAENANSASNEAANQALFAESWAVGSTGHRAGEDTNNSKYWAQVAQQGAEHSGYAIFDVNDQDGQMYVTITDPLSQDVSFLVNETTGELEVTING